MSKKANIIQILIFVCFIGIAFLLNLILPDKEFSEVENKYLKQMPKFTIKDLVSGEFTSDFEEYTSDQFIARDAWITIKAAAELAVGKGENNDVYYCDNGTLVTRFDAPDEENIRKKAGYINTFAEKAGIPVYVGIIPGAAEIWSDMLPENAPNDSQTDMIDKLYSNVNTHIIDIEGTLEDHKNEYIFYRTDHHWTSLGAYYTFCANSTAMGITGSTSEYDVYTVTDSFEGTLSSKSGSHSAMDHIEIYAPKNSSVEYYVTYPDSQDKVCSIFRSDCLEVKDKYTVFFGGNHSIVEIKTTANNGKNLLLFKDSYANCFVQFLIPHYENIIMVDPRYYYDNVDSIMNNQGITDVLFLYCADTILTDTSLTDVLTAGTQNDAPLTEALTETPAVTEEIPVDGSAAEGSVVEESIIEGSVLP